MDYNYAEVSELVRQLAVTRYERDLCEGEITRLRSSILNIKGDNLCWLNSDPETKIPPREEFLESCSRFHAQLSARNGVLEGCRTIAQLEARIAELERDNIRSYGDRKE